MNLFIQLIKDLCKWTCVCSGRREVVQLNYWRPNESWQVKQAIVTQQSGFFQGGAKHANLTTYGDPGLLFRMGLKCCRISLETYVSAVDPACKVRGFVHWNLTIQPGFCWLTSQQGIFTIHFPFWDQVKLTLNPFWPYISGSYKRARLYPKLSLRMCRELWRGLKVQLMKFCALKESGGTSRMAEKLNCRKLI